jgi:hypothetical protein
MLRDGERAATGDEGHEKGSADILGEQLAPADVVVACKTQLLARSRMQPSNLTAPHEVETAAVQALVNLELPGKIHEAVLRHWQVAAAGRRHGHKGAGQVNHTALPCRTALYPPCKPPTTLLTSGAL